MEKSPKVPRNLEVEIIRSLKLEFMQASIILLGIRSTPYLQIRQRIMD